MTFSMERKMAILHTTPLTVSPLKELALKKLPGITVVNFVDDSILPQLLQNGGDISEVEERIIQYAKFAEEVGTQVILNACSSVGEVVSKACKQVNIPIIRIDEAMAEEAINKGERIGVVATLSTTLNPTMKLLKQKAERLNKEVKFQSMLADEAYQKLSSGDKQGHDERLAEVLTNIAQEVDVVVLAQASMASVVETLPKDIQSKFISSPELGMERVKTTFEGVSQ